MVDKMWFDFHNFSKNGYNIFEIRLLILNFVKRRYHAIYSRFPLEVLQHKQYSKEGDVYMLAMAIYEFYMGLQIN